MISTKFKGFLKSLLPPEWTSQYYLEELYDPPVVRAGIFRGMKYVRESVCSSLLPKFIGCYEKELVPVFEALLERKPKLILDIGAAEGYYAVGLARLLPDCKVIAFETTPEGRRLIGEMAVLNHLDSRIDIRGECTPEDFRALVAKNRPDFVLMDIEGAEADFITADAANLLGETELLIEVHPLAVANVEKDILAAAEKTHFSKRITPLPRIVSDYWRTFNLFQRAFCGKTLTAFMGEGRSASHWLWLTPR
jgi:precorrin-6B methylase 2